MCVRYKGRPTTDHDPALPPHRDARGFFHNPPGAPRAHGTTADWLRFIRAVSFGPKSLRQPAIPAGPVLDEKAVHASPEEAVRIGRAMGAKRLVAMHWGTVALTTEPAFEPPPRFTTAAALAGYAPDQAWLMTIGEARAL